MGTLNLTGTLTGLVIEVTNAERREFPPLSPGGYSVPAGDYVVRARPADDISWLWTWSANVHVQADQTAVVPVPDSAKAHTALWQLYREQLGNERLRVEYLTAQRDAERLRQAGQVGFWTGAIAGLAAAASYALGNAEMAAYRNADTDSSAQTDHVLVAACSGALVLSSALSALGFADGIVCWVTEPRTDELQRQIRLSQDRITALARLAHQGTVAE